MAPNKTVSPTGVLVEDDIVETVAETSVEPKNNESKPPQKYRRQIVWRNVILFVYLHVAAVYGAYLMLTSAKIITTVFGVYCIRLLCKLFKIHLICSSTFM
jgi:stearoyl-CoA desaturase (delta-9 desaturase)